MIDIVSKIEHCLLKLMAMHHNSVSLILVSPAPFNAGNRRLMFLDRFNYIDVISLDKVLTLDFLYMQCTKNTLTKEVATYNKVKVLCYRNSSHYHITNDNTDFDYSCLFY